MSDTAAAQLRRILHVIPEVADGKFHSLASVAGRAGVDVATLRGDLHSLVTRYHEPGGFVEGVRVYLESDKVQVVSNHFRRPMRLTVPELRALELGLAMLTAERPPDEHRTLDRARMRLRKTIAKLPNDPLTDGDRAATAGIVGDPAHLATLRQALRGRVKLRLKYQSSGAEKPTTRDVCPYALVASNGMFYVVAYCGKNSGIRVFRMDRVHGAELTRERFELPEEFSLDDVLKNDRVFLNEKAGVMKVRYSKRIARWISERTGVKAASDGTVTVEHPLADVAWGVRFVLQYGPDAEVLEPEEVRVEIRKRLGELL
jgi:proteasome accessory factor C